MPAPSYSLASDGGGEQIQATNSSSPSEGQLKQDFNQLSSSGRMRFNTPDLSIFHDGHPTFRSKVVGNYRYWYDESDMNSPLVVGLIGEIDQYFAYDKEFQEKIWRFVRQREMDKDKKDAAYVYYKGVEMKGSFKWVDGLLGIGALGGWEETKIGSSGIEANLSTGDIEVSLPGPSLGTIQMNLDEPYWGIKPYLKPSFSLGVFGMEFDIPKSEVGITFGIAEGGFGTEIKLVFGVNTNNTSRDFQEYLCYELMPWVGEIKDALG